MPLEQFADTTLSWSDAAIPASATAAYTAWLAALGATETTGLLDGSNSRTMLTGAPFVTGATSRTVWSQSGGVGLFYSTPTNETPTPFTLTPTAGNWLTYTPPDLILIIQDANLGSWATSSSRVAVSGGTALLFARIAQPSAPGSSAVEVALRITAGNIDVVATNVSAGNAVIRAYTKVGYVFTTGQTVRAGFTGTAAYALTTSSTPRQVGAHLLSSLSGVWAPYGPLPIYPPIAQQASGNAVDVLPRGLPVGWKDGPVAGAAPTHPWEHKGPGKISGTVKERGAGGDAPVHRLVRLIRDRDGVLVRSAWSDPTTGAYSFSGVPIDYQYTALSYDFNKNFRAVAADNLTPELMP